MESVNVKLDAELITEWQSLTGMSSDQVANEIGQLISAEIVHHKAEQCID